MAKMNIFDRRSALESAIELTKAGIQSNTTIPNEIDVLNMVKAIYAALVSESGFDESNPENE